MFHVKHYRIKYDNKLFVIEGRQITYNYILRKNHRKHYHIEVLKIFSQQNVLLKKIKC